MLVRLSRVIVLGGIALVYGCGDSGAPDSSGGAGATGSGGNGAGGSSSSGSTSTGGGGGGCDYTPVDNPDGCPPEYSHALSGQPCSINGLECWYPGVGDGLPNGCNATALLRCTNEFTDGGVVWVAAQ